MIADAVELRIVVHAAAGAAGGQGIHHHFGDAGARAVAHKQDAIGEQDGFVHVMSDHEYGLLSLAADAQQFVLYGAAGQGIERAEGLVE